MERRISPSITRLYLMMGKMKNELGKCKKKRKVLKRSVEVRV